MPGWPAKLNVTADGFAFADAEALFEHIGPWLFDALDSGRAPLPITQTGLAYLVFSDVANGGLEQFLANKSGAALACASALREVGFPLAADLLEDGARGLPPGFAARDVQARWDFTSQDGKIASLSDVFWSALTEDAFVDALARYARLHKDAFAPYFTVRP